MRQRQCFIIQDSHLIHCPSQLRDVILRKKWWTIIALWWHCGINALWWQETAEFNQILLPHTTQGQSLQEYWGVDSKKIQNSKHVDFISKEIERMFLRTKRGFLETNDWKWLKVGSKQRLWKGFCFPPRPSEVGRGTRSKRFSLSY